MEPADDPGDAAGDLDPRLAAATERAGHGARLLLRAAAANHRLSIVQAQILLRIAARSTDTSITALTAEFDVRQPTISDAVTALKRKGLLTTAKRGRRHQLVLTGAGAAVTDDLEGWDLPLREAFAHQSEAAKGETLQTLLGIIARLQATGVINIARSCTTCRFYRPDTHPRPDAPHYCALLEAPLRRSDLRLDCPEHQPAIA